MAAPPAAAPLRRRQPRQQRQHLVQAAATATLAPTGTVALAAKPNRKVGGQDSTSWS